VVSCLIEANGKGVLTEIIKWLTTSQQNLLHSTASILDLETDSNDTMNDETSTHTDWEDGSESYSKKK
jgi:hypothetical protein